MIFTLDINVNMFLYCGNDPISHDYLVNCASKSVIQLVILIRENMLKNNLF